MMQSPKKTDSAPLPPLSVGVKNRFHLIVLLFTLAICLVIGAVTAPVSKNSINNEKNAIFAQPWQYSIDNGAYQSVNLPYSEKGQISEQVTLRNHLPPVAIKGATVLLRTSQQYAEVFVDNIKIYSSYVDGPDRNLPSSAYHFVRLPADCAGKEISVVLSAPVPRYAGAMNQIYIGSKASNIFFLAQENGWRFLLSAILFMVGLFLMLAFVLTKKQHSLVGVVYLGAFFICSGFWLLVESRLMQFIVPYPAMLTNLSIFAITLMPVFSGLYYYVTYIRSFKTLGRVALVCMGLVSLSMAVVAVMNPLLPFALLPFYLVIIGVYVVMMFLLIILENRRKSKLRSIPFWGAIAFGVCGLAELVLYLADMKGYNGSNLLMLGLLLFCVAMMIDLTRNVAKAYQSSVQVNALTVLAYTDGLTGLGNYTAFLERMTTYDVEHDGLVSLAMFDINDLKLVNDTLGHLVGDAIIKHCAQVLKNTIRAQDELFRIGGDEFAVMFHHDYHYDGVQLEARLTATLEKESRKPLSYKLSIAFGCAAFVKGADKDLFETLARADKKMYEYKNRQKNAK